MIRRRVPACAHQVWAAVTDFQAHGQHAPLTQILCEPGAEHLPHLGWRFISRTRLGPLVIDDRMRLTRWKPPAEDGIAAFHAHKVGPVLSGWAAVQVRPEETDGTTLITWVEHIRVPARPARWAEPALGPLLDLAASWLFARVLDGLLADLVRGRGT